MSMICYLLGLTPAQLASLRSAPALTRFLTYVAASHYFEVRTEEMLRRMTTEQRTRFEESRATSQVSSAQAERETRVANAREQIAVLCTLEPAVCLDKSWHMLHYLFTGRLNPTGTPGDLLLTGEELGDDAGYGPARIHSPQTTNDFSLFVEKLTAENLSARVNLREMRHLGVYAMPSGQGSEAEWEEGLRREVEVYFAS